MAIVVRDNLKNKLYILVGAGFGNARTARPLTAISSGSFSISSEMLAVADSSGEISYLPAA